MYVIKKSIYFDKVEEDSVLSTPGKFALFGELAEAIPIFNDRTLPGGRKVIDVTSFIRER